MTVAEMELIVEELVVELETKLKEIPNAKRTAIVEANVEGLKLDRFDSSSPEYHLHPLDVVLLRQQYEASLTDPRRI